MNFDDVFSDLNDMMTNAFTYTPMSDEQYQISCVKDIEQWAFEISSAWNGKYSGVVEQKALLANEIMAKCQELKSLISEMEDL